MSAKMLINDNSWNGMLYVTKDATALIIQNKYKLTRKFYSTNGLNYYNKLTFCYYHNDMPVTINCLLNCTGSRKIFKTQCYNVIDKHFPIFD